MQRTVAIVAAVPMAATTYAGHLALADTPHYSTRSAPLNVESAFPGTDPTLNTAALEGCPAISSDERTPLPDVINRPGSREFCPTPLRDGKTLLFVSEQGGGCGLGPIYVAREHPTHGWSEPEHLPCGVNSDREEASPFIVEYDDGTVELYFSTNRVRAGPSRERRLSVTVSRREARRQLTALQPPDSRQHINFLRTHRSNNWGPLSSTS